MEGSSSKTEIKWPGPVTFQEDDPKRGYVSIFLDIPELVTRRFSISKEKKPDIHCKFSQTAIDVEVRVNTEGNLKKYVYSKSSPEDINPNKSRYKIRNGKLELQVKKDGPVTWTIHRRHFMERPANFKNNNNNSNNNNNNTTEGISFDNDTTSTMTSMTSTPTSFTTATTTTTTTMT